MSRTSRRTRWILVALTSVALLALAAIGLTPFHTATAAGPSDIVCYKVENPAGTITINRDGLIMTITIGTYPDHREPNANNAVTSVVVDPASQVKSGQITVKGGPDANVYAFGDATPFHAPPRGAQHKWPTISYVQVCWHKPAPPQVGRAEITKVVTGEDAPADTVFEITLTPEQGDPITKTITGAGVIAFDNLKPGRYTVSETDPGENWEVTYSAATIDVKAHKTAKATVTNSYTKPAPQLGKAQITKTVVGDDAPEAVFEITLTPNEGDPITKTITGAGVITFDNLTPGAYTLSETDPGENWTVTYSTETITIVANQTATATVTNSYTKPAPQLGKAEITKTVVGDDAPEAIFEITLTPNEGDPITKTIIGAGVLTFDDLTPGTYTLSETHPGENWTVMYSTETITIVANQTAKATITNTYAKQVVPSELGSVVVTKVVVGDPPTATYEIGLIGPAPALTERWLPVVGAGEVVFEAVPVGTYAVVERGPGDGYTVAISPKTVVVTNGGVARATVTNTYVAQQPVPPTMVPPTTVPPKVHPDAGAQPPATAPAARQNLPKTGSDGQLATIALTTIAGGLALAAISRRRATS